MRKLILKPRAEQAIYEVADWVAEKNLPRSGQKFLEKVAGFLFEYASIKKLEYPLCKNKRLAALKLSCIVFNKKWVFAFKYTRKEFVVYEFLWGAKLY